MYAANPKGKTFDTNSVFSYDGMMLIADVLERAGRDGLRLDRWDPGAVVTAIKKSQFPGGLAVSTGPVVFNEIGDNPNASSAMIQILGQKPVVVWPKDAAEQKFVLPGPKRCPGEPGPARHEATRRHTPPRTATGRHRPKAVRSSRPIRPSDRAVRSSCPDHPVRSRAVAEPG